MERIAVIDGELHGPQGNGSGERDGKSEVEAENGSAAHL
jgi:hypothetical protein